MCDEKTRFVKFMLDEEGERKQTRGRPRMYRVGQKKPDHFLKCITFLYNDLGRQSIYQNVQLFIGSKNDILNAAVFQYSLHKVRETTLH